jgi:glutamate dehydrogenase/leucine dehydrogenase
MTLKNAAAGLPHGGGKAVIVGDPAMPEPQKAQLIRAFAAAIDEMSGYIPGPDMGTNETCMGWVLDQIGRAVGLPRVLGGIPLDEIGATGFGVAVASEVAEGFCDVRLDGARVAIQGFGAVGKHAARHLIDRGVRLVAVSDTGGTVLNPDELPLDDLIALKEAGKSVTALSGATAGPGEAVITADCDILIPAARPDAIKDANVDGVKARLIVEGANIPVRAETETTLHERGVLIVPDFIANAGGVICASVEYHGGSKAMAFNSIEEKIRRNTAEVLTQSRDTGSAPRAAAEALAFSRVSEAMTFRRFA